MYHGNQCYTASTGSVCLAASFAASAELVDLLWEGLRVCEVVVGCYVVVDGGVEFPPLHLMRW